MNVYGLTKHDRDLLLTGADLEAVLADRERERLERDERDQPRLAQASIARLVVYAAQPATDEGYTDVTPVRA